MFLFSNKIRKKKEKIIDSVHLSWNDEFNRRNLICDSRAKCNWLTKWTWSNGRSMRSFKHNKHFAETLNCICLKSKIKVNFSLNCHNLIEKITYFSAISCSSSQFFINFAWWWGSIGYNFSVLWGAKIVLSPWMLRAWTTSDRSNWVHPVRLESNSIGSRFRSNKLRRNKKVLMNWATSKSHSKLTL